MAERIDPRRLETPIFQAGMGGVARHELAAAVSEAGGVGTIAGAQASIADELAAARRLTGRPLAVNLLSPFVRRGDAEAAAEADLVITFWGEPRRPGAVPWIHQCGSVQEAKAAAAAGADAVIAQGVEAGGHVRGTMPALELLERVKAAVPLPVLVAGGIADRDDVMTALEAGAAAVVVGTRFLLSSESHAHAEYKQRCQAAQETILTELFGFGWARAPHRVIANAATRRWLGEGADQDGAPPRWVKAANRITQPMISRVPPALQARALGRQRPSIPLLSPQPPTDDGPRGLLDSGPLYAGETVARLDDVLPAAEIVRRLTP